MPAKKQARKQLRRQPETLRLRSVTPSLTATDLQRSITWYRDVLGFTVGERWEEGGRYTGVELKAGAVTVTLNQDDFAKGRDRKKGEGFRLYCNTAQDIDRFAAEIQSRGGTLDRGPEDTPWGSRLFAITDPDGFKLSFIQER